MKCFRVFIGIFMAMSLAASAHQPRLVLDRTSIEVRTPEVSQAFYARLNGSAQSYYIRSDVAFHLYVNLLVPDLRSIRTDYEAVIYRGQESPDSVLARLEGTGFAWKPFYEPFAGDRYYLGPEFEQDVEKGTYIVVVSNPGLHGKYALAIGKKEKFPPGEWIRTIAILPRLKKQFFEKSPLTAYFNLTGLFILVIVAGAVGLKKLVF